MLWNLTLAALALVFGALLTISNVADGVQFSFPLLLGLLLLADGVLRLMSLPRRDA